MPDTNAGTLADPIPLPVPSSDPGGGSETTRMDHGGRTWRYAGDWSDYVAREDAAATGRPIGRMPSHGPACQWAPYSYPASVWIADDLTNGDDDGATSDYLCDTCGEPRAPFSGTCAACVTDAPLGRYPDGIARDPYTASLSDADLCNIIARVGESSPGGQTARAEQQWRDCEGN